MSWEDRLRIGTYISPEGNSFEFEFLELTRTSGKKAPTKEIPLSNKADTEDLGNAIVNLPLEIFFSGENYDIIADAFWNSTRENGKGTLKHPRWGNLSVLPISVKQTENFVTATTQASFSVTFKIIDEVSFPETNKETEGEVKSELDKFVESAAEFFANIIAVTVGEKSALIAFFSAANSIIDSALGPLTEGTEAIATEFNTILNNLESNIDELLDEPIILAQNYIRLVRLPARAQASMNAKFNGYKAVFDTIFDPTSPLNNELFPTVNENKNRALQQELFGFAIQTSLIDTYLFVDYSTEIDISISSTDDLVQGGNTVFTKKEVLAIIDNLIQNFLQLITELDLRQQEFENEILENKYQYSPQSYEFIKNATNLTTALLLDKSFTLKTEKAFTLTESSTPLNLAYKYYGGIDFLDFFISSNSLIDEEFFVVPQGREILIYD